MIIYPVILLTPDYTLSNNLLFAILLSTMRFITCLLRRTLLSLITLNFAAQVAASSSLDPTNLSNEVFNLFQFQGNGSFIDNIEFRPDGTVLLTRIDVPEVWSVDPHTGTGSLVYNFSGDNATISSCFGITEIDYDVFAVVAGEFDVKTFQATPGSFSIWKLDFTVQHKEDHDTLLDGRFKRTFTPTVSKVAEIPEAKALGASTLFRNRESRYLLVSDSPEGMIWKIDLKTGYYNIPTLSDESMLPAPNGPPMGVNGIHIFDGYLYYASVTRREFRRVQLDDTASANGPYELVLDNTALDNFDISIEGDVYFATNTENMIMRLSADGELVPIAGDRNSVVLAGPTCCKLHPSGTELFVGTNGGLTAPVNDWFEEPGKLAAIYV